MNLKVMSKVKSKITIGLPGKNPTTLIQVIFLCDAYFSNYPAVPEFLTHPVYHIICHIPEDMMKIQILQNFKYIILENIHSLKNCKNFFVWLHIFM